MFELKSPEALQALASRLAPFASARDFIALHGDLGSGKTAFAQGFLAALGVKEAVTSPTFQLVHTHDAGSRLVFHCDFYRIKPFEEEEIGFREMCEGGLVLAEWPRAISSPLPPDRLEVHIAGTGSIRTVALMGFGAWKDKLARFEAANAFLDEEGWAAASVAAIKGDASARSFWRLDRGDTAMFVDWPRKPDGPPIRDGRPYCDIAHLARDGRSYVTLSRWLREEAGIAAPEVYAADLGNGLYLVEDLGDAVFADLVVAGSPVEELHSLAVDGLLAIREAEARRPERAREDFRGIPFYDREALEVELELLPRWYFKLVAGQECAAPLVRSFFAAWAPFLDWLGRQKSGLVLRDYHSPNLLLRPDRQGLSRLGIVDFQDAVLGHPAYDLVSLLQDARVDVPEAAERALFARHGRGVQSLGLAFDAEAFARAYAILGAQRNTKILGIFARLSLRDGKHGYLGHFPRVARYLLRNLAHPDLAPLKAWYEAHLFGRPPHRPGEGGSWHTPHP